jgi:hypothetical protein
MYTPRENRVPAPPKDWEDEYRRLYSKHNELKILYNQKEEFIKKYVLGTLTYTHVDVSFLLSRHSIHFCMNAYTYSCPLAYTDACTQITGQNKTTGK